VNARVFDTLDSANDAIGIVNSYMGYPLSVRCPDMTLCNISTYAIAEELVDGRWAIIVKRDVDIAAGVTSGARESIDRKMQVIKEVDAIVIPHPVAPIDAERRQ
jgi:hypothetical protein